MSAIDAARRLTSIERNASDTVRAHRDLLEQINPRHADMQMMLDLVEKWINEAAWGDFTHVSSLLQDASTALDRVYAYTDEQKEEWAIEYERELRNDERRTA